MPARISSLRACQTCRCWMQIFQGTALSLILRYSRTGIGPPYLASVAVIWTEFIKLFICIVAQCLVCKRTSREKGITYFREVQHDLREIISTSFPMIVPAALFVMQQVCCFPLHCLPSLVCQAGLTLPIIAQHSHHISRRAPSPAISCMTIAIKKQCYMSSCLFHR